LLCALTGSAANNIKSIVDNDRIDNSTLHKFIFGTDSYKVVIIDELSLVDTETFYKFLQKY
jgi:hypothetical protein